MGEMKKPKNLFKIGLLQPGLCFAIFPIIDYIEMAPLFQYSFVVGCLVNSGYSICMESNLMNLATKTGYKSQNQLQMEIFSALAKEPEFKKIYIKECLINKLNKFQQPFRAAFLNVFLILEMKRELNHC